MKTTLRLTLVLLVLISGSCNVINPAEEVPTLVHIPAFTFESVSGFGSDSENITEVWVYANDQYLGAYSVPADVPVVGEGVRTMTFRAGIRNNGISATRIPYPFYTDVDISLLLEPMKRDTITPAFTYRDDLPDPALLDDFDGGTIFNEASDSQASFLTTQDDNEVFEGSGSGKVFLDTEETIFKAENSEFIELPFNKRTFFEMDYKCDNSFAIGLFAFDGSEEAKNLALILKPTTDDNGQAQWNKIYIDLQQIVAANPNADNFKLYIEAVKDSGNSTATFYFDNFKIIHF
ncbi:MAG: hypothetical protein HRT74_01110 [Flavobacteriales bacterium]|nr:hypothetical protein [Flavobacteriales bacterium]